MVPSSADIVLQNHRISQSETSTISICDVVNTIWRCRRGLAAMKMSLCQYFRLLIDYRDIWIYPNERTMACAVMPTNYFVVVVLPSRQIKRVVRLTACNYERCVSVTIFFERKIRLRRLQTIPLDKINEKRTARAITSIQPSKYVLDVNLHTICQPS